MAGGFDILGIAAGASLAAAIAVTFWIAGDDDWRDALADDEAWGDVANINEMSTASNSCRAGRASQRPAADVRGHIAHDRGRS